MYYFMQYLSFTIHSQLQGVRYNLYVDNLIIYELFRNLCRMTVVYTCVSNEFNY